MDYYLLYCIKNYKWWKMVSTESISVILVRCLCYFISCYPSLECNIPLWTLIHGYLSIYMLTIWNQHRIYDIYLFSIIPRFFSLIWKCFSKHFPPFLIICNFLSISWIKQYSYKYDSYLSLAPPPVALRLLE
jgi:hypothetical protein